MSYMDELRERFRAAETRFGRINEAGRDYRDRLMGLMSRVEEEIRCRRDVEQQQAREIERLTGEIENLSGENEQLRTMMMSLLTAVEVGDSDILGDTLNEMDSKVATLIGEGQGAATAIQLADESPPEPASETPDFSAETVDESADEADEGEAFQAPSFPAGDFMLKPGGVAGSNDMIAEETEMPAAMEPEPVVPEADPEPVDSDDAAAYTAPISAEPDGDGAADMAAFYGADDHTDVDAVPDYSNAVGGWADFLDDDQGSPVAAASDGAAESPVSEVSDDFVAEDAGDPEAGSIHDLIDRVKTEVDGEESDAEAASLESDDDSGQAAAQ